MKTKYTIALCLLIAATACSSIQEEPANTERVKNTADEVFYATLEQSGSASDTKVYADENLKVLWNADDRITIYNRYTYGYQYAFQGITGDSAGAFLKKEDDAEFVTGNPLEHIFAVYPYREDNKINNSGDLSITWPSTQTYKADSFGIGANVMVSVTDNNQLRFRNVGGYLAIKLYGDNVSVSSITLRGNNGEKLSGRATVKASTEADPTLTFQSASSESLRLECPAPVSIGSTAETATIFWLVVPPTHFSQGFNITVCTSDDGAFVKSTNSDYVIERNTLCRMAPVEVVPADIIPFEDANFKAYCVENFDTDNDGEISFQEAMEIDTVSVNTNGIYSMRGIEYMPNLTYLRCSGSTVNRIAQGQLTDLDVSHNTALTILNCSNNRLTTLDINNNTALTGLYCYRNKLTSLDVSKCPELTDLCCGYNQLTNLNVKDNLCLSHLECYGNPMTSLDLSGCSSLTFVDCAPGNADAPGLLTNLNVDGCTALESLDCYNNQLTSLDLSGCTALESLDCYNNHLSSLDVSNNSALTYLRCDSNPYLTEIWLIAGQNVQLKYDSSIARINYIGLSDIILFDDANFKAYCVANFDTNKDGEVSAAEAFPVIRINVNTDNIYSISGLEYFTNLQYLSACGSAAKYEDWVTIGDTSGLPDAEEGTSVASGNLSRVILSGLTHLQSIDISRNNCIVDFTTSNCSSLREIRCEFCNITSLDVSQNTALTSLSCEFNQLTALDVSSNTALTGLACSYNQLTALDVKNNTALFNLSCSDNQLTVLDVSNNTALLSLYCSSNQLSALNVLNNTALIYLYCGDNQLTALDVSNNTSLAHFGCTSNLLTALDISNNAALTYLSCFNNQLTALNVSNNTALISLLCYDNQLTALDVSNNSALTSLYCDSNQLTSLDVSHNTHLTDLFCHSNQLTTLDVSNNTELKYLSCHNNPYLTEIWLKTGQTIQSFAYDTSVAQIYYKE